MGMPVSELSERLTTAEEAYWIALYRTDPWGDQRADMRSALIAQLIHNTHAKKPRKMQDFMLFSDKPKPKGSDSATIRKNFDRLIARQKK